MELLEWEIFENTYSPFERIVGVIRSYTKASANSSATKEEMPIHVHLALEYAVRHIEKNINTKSKYLLCTWDEDNMSLTIVVTDETRLEDSRYVTEIFFGTLRDDPRIRSMEDEELQRLFSEYTKIVRRALHDFVRNADKSVFGELSVAFEFYDSSDPLEILYA